MIIFLNMREKFRHFFTKDETMITGLAVCHAISNMFLGTFIISFLMHNSIAEIVSVSTYRLFYYFAMCITFILVANWCKCGNKKLVFSMNIITRIILLGLIAVLGTKAADYVILLGGLYGIFDGFYSLPIYSITIEKVPYERMVFFTGIKSMIKNTFKIIVPVTLGFIITTKSLQNTAWIIMIIAILEIIMLCLLSPSVNKEQNSVNITGFIRSIKENSTVKTLFVSEIFRGFATILETVVTMYIVYVFHTDMKLGIWTTIFTFCTVIASWAFGRFCSRSDYKWIIVLCSVLMLSTATMLFINVTNITTLAYACTSTICFEIMYQISNANAIDMARTKFITQDNRTEYLVVRNIMVFIGQWFALVTLMYIGVFELYKILGIFIILAVIALISGCFLSSSITKDIDKNI